MDDAADAADAAASPRNDTPLVVGLAGVCDCDCLCSYSMPNDDVNGDDANGDDANGDKDDDKESVLLGGYLKTTVDNGFT